GGEVDTAGGREREGTAYLVASSMQAQRGRSRCRHVRWKGVAYPVGQVDVGRANVGLAFAVGATQEIIALPAGRDHVLAANAAETVMHDAGPRATAVAENVRADEADKYRLQFVQQLAESLRVAGIDR